MPRKIFQVLLLIIFAFGVNLSVFAQDDNLPELVKKIKPSAVAIETFGAKGEKLSRGSGFFVSADRIITNRHVIENASKVTIHLNTGKKYQVKGILATDGESDLALMEVEVTQEFISALPLEKAIPQEGESVFVIGNPYGLEGSVTNGIVSAVRDIAGYGRIIQITAPISPGSSGSPVVNMKGQVIGVATLQAEEGQSLNFAVPSERVLQLKIGELQAFDDLNASMKRNRRLAAERAYSLGVGILSRDDYAKAVVYFEKASQIDTDYAEAFYQAGFCYGMLKKHAESLKASRQAVKLRPDWAEAYVNIGASTYALTQYKESVEAYKTAVRLDSYNPNNQFALGLAFNKLNRTDEEILAYKRAISLKPDHTSALERLGLAYFKMKRYTEAVTVFEQYKTYQGDAKSYNYLGECYFELGKFEQSVEVLNTAVSLNPEFDKARYNLGRAYLKSDDRENAQAQYEILRLSKSDWADRLLALLNP